MNSPKLASMLFAFWFICLNALLLFSSNLICFQPKGAAAAALGNQTDNLALLKFKESISKDPYETLASWNSSSHFCNWHGITCSHRHQRVRVLNLQGYGLHGVISPYLGNLSFLRILSLENNSFSGEIPQELGRLFRLQQLLLTNNTLVSEIPSNLTSCSELGDLSIGGNNLVGQIPMEIGSLSKLETLYLPTNNLKGQIPASIGNLSSLSILYMGYNNLEGSLPEEIGRLKNLIELSIPVNKLSGELPSSLYNLSSVIKLSLAINQFNGSLRANMFLTLPNLQRLTIGANYLSGPLPASMTNASLLNSFDVITNDFVGQVPSLENLRDLSWLNVANNHLGSNSTKDWAFLKPLANCSKLQVLVLSNNSFASPLPNSIGNLSIQLSQLYLDGIQIPGKIPETIGNLINLDLLTMKYNDFSGIIPTSFGNFHKLKTLNLEGNKLSGEISTFIGNLSQLFHLELQENMLEGNIPPSIVYCQSLQYLDLSQNNLSGDIPSQLFGLSSLSILLNLSINSLTGYLPMEVGKLKNIGTLDISKNYLSGDIPRTIGDCISLEYLYLQGNSFQGTIPSSLASLKGLRHLDLSQNKLSGSIPQVLQDIYALEYLNVSFNMLDGDVPTKGVFQNASVVAVIGNNKLCGGISELQLPPCPIKAMKKGKRQHFKLIVVIICVVVFLLLLSSIFAIYCLRKRNRKSSSSSPTIDLLSKVSYHSLYHATNGFSISNLIGSGSFGSVYKGRWETEEGVVAIKVLNLQRKGADKSFIAECNALRNIRHRNLVKILTCCSSRDYKGKTFKALVFEYMTNGCLENWLHQGLETAEKSRTLNLGQRLNIVIDIASALHYLHIECVQPIVHCDLKPSNILLDDDMIAHVGDFGLARLLSPIIAISNKETSTIGIKGTIGYAPPEYGMDFEVSTKGDMYSFGILVLEILTGRRPTEEMFKEGYNLHNHVRTALPNNLLQIMDPALLPREFEQTTKAIDAEINLENPTHLHHSVKKCLLSLCRIGLACSVESANKRMNVVDVNKELHLIKKAFLADGIKVSKFVKNSIENQM